VLNLLYFYISTFRRMCAVPNMAVFCSSLTSCFLGMLLTYFLNDFEIIIIIIIRYGYLLSQSFLPGISLEPAMIPNAQASSFTLQYFLVMCDVPSIAVFCSESIVCLSGIVSKCFLKLLVTNAVAQINAGTIVHFRFHIR